MKKCWLVVNKTTLLFAEFQDQIKGQGETMTMTMKKSGNDVLYYNCNSGTWVGNLIGPSQLSQ